MKQKTTSIFIIITLLFPQVSFVAAQTLDTTAPTATSTEPAPTTSTAPVEETIAPPADTTGPVFVSVATASAGESEVNIVWTTDEMAYGFVEYGETTSYGQATPKSASATMDHTVTVAGLTPGTAYHYRIVAEDESGNISYSKDRTFETALEAVAIDNVPPEITEVSAMNITASGATITWMTDELAQGKIEYGKTAEYGKSSPLTDDYATEHSASFSNLDADTEYHYRVVVQDESGNESVSPDEVFTTDPAPVTAPTEETTATSTPETTATATSSPTSEPTATSTSSTTTASSTSTTATSTTTTATTTSTTTATTSTSFAISHVETATVSTSSAVIIWKTSEQADSQVFYGTSESYASSSAVSATNATSHEMKLVGLKSGTNYFYKVVSKNSSGKTIEKSGFEFNTLYKQKTIAVAPTISNITVRSVGTSTVTIVFDTDILAGGKINYGTTTAYEKTDGGHNTFLTKHSHPLSGLKPNTTYNFETVVWGADGSETLYENMTFTTLAETVTETLAAVPVAIPAPARSFGGGGYSYAPQRVFGKAVVTKVAPLDKQILFVWQKASHESGIETIIVKNENGHVTMPGHGAIVYQGNSGRFADINLQNGKKYYYSVFRTNATGVYSLPLHFTVAPKQDMTQVKIIATPPVVQRTPIYTFSKTLSRGDQNKQVEHLQVVLASESSIYQKGLITGFFGPLTENAVKKFQKRYQLPVTGVAGNATLKKLEQLSSIEIIKDKADAYDQKLTRELATGLKGEDVSVLQQFLVNAEVYPEALVTGYFGSLTRLAVQRFQREQNISPSSGYFGPLTKKRMLNLIRLRSVSF